MKCVATLCLMMCYVLPAFGQIILTENDIQALVGTTQVFITYSTDERPDAIQALINTDGANQTWDFTVLPFDEDESVRTTKTLATEAPADAPGHGEAPFNQADYVLIDAIGADSVNYDFLQSGTDGVYFLGTTGAYGTNSEVRSTYDSPILLLPLPATYGDTWTSNATFTLTDGGNTYEIEETLNNEMDGYGTLILPHGSFEVLRQKQVLSLATPFGTTQQTNYFYYTNAVDVVAGMSAIELPFGTYYLASYNRPADGDPNTASENLDVPATFSLHANYPNPFNPSTEIRFDLHQQATVSLVVTDLAGRIVAHLADESLSVGTYRYTFDATTLSSGLYLYRLTAGSHSATRPMLLVK